MNQIVGRCVKEASRHVIPAPAGTYTSRRVAELTEGNRKMCGLRPKTKDQAASAFSSEVPILGINWAREKVKSPDSVINDQMVHATLTTEGFTEKGA